MHLHLQASSEQSSDRHFQPVPFQLPCRELPPGTFPVLLQASHILLQEYLCTSLLSTYRGGFHYCHKDICSACRKISAMHNWYLLSFLCPPSLPMYMFQVRYKQWNLPYSLFQDLLLLCHWMWQLPVFRPEAL